MIKKILVIGDAHAKSTVDNRRFNWLASFITDHQPDIIVNMGDWYDMPSLCSYDKGTKDFEGRRYQSDICAGNDALARLENGINAVNKSRRSIKKSLYKPRKIALGGNHDFGRIKRATRIQPELEGTISIDDFAFKDYGWEVYPYRTPVIIENVAFVHDVQVKGSDNAMSGEFLAANLVRKKLASVVVGHQHNLDFAERTDISGRKVMGLVPGWYGDPLQYEDYAGENNKLWWKGLVLFNDVHDGGFDHSTWSIERIQRQYA